MTYKRSINLLSNKNGHKGKMEFCNAAELRLVFDKCLGGYLVSIPKITFPFSISCRLYREYFIQ